MGAYETGQALLAGVLAKLPAEQQAQAKAIFEAAEAKDALTVLGDSGLARSDYSKQMDELRAKQENLNNWYGVNKTALDEYVAHKQEIDLLKAGGVITQPGDPYNPAPPKPAPAAPSFTKEDVAKQVQAQLDAVMPDSIGISAWMATKAVQHQATFGEVLPAMTIVKTAMEARAKGQPMTLDEAYNLQYHDQLAQKAKEADDRRIEAEVQKRLAEARPAAGHPYPLRSEPTVLDALTAKTDPAEYTANAAAAEYERLVSLKP